MNEALVLETQRLRLGAMTRRALQAWVDEDVPALETATGALFPVPLEAPPLFGEDLPMFRDRMTETPDELGWWVWLVSRRADRRAVGVCGLGGHPGPDGVALLGYSIYPRYEGRGYATEASRELVRWTLAQPRAAAVRATVPAWNLGSVAVALKLGMENVGYETHPEVGEVGVFEIRRER